MSFLSPHSTGGVVQSIAGYLKGHGDVPSSMLLVGRRMIVRGSRSRILFGTHHAFLEDMRQSAIDYWGRIGCS